MFPATHQSGRSSGVIHAGIYYKPGSLMAKLCVEGLHRMYKFCEKHDVPHSRCGKVMQSHMNLRNTIQSNTAANKLLFGVKTTPITSCSLTQFH